MLSLARPSHKVGCTAVVPQTDVTNISIGTVKMVRGQGMPSPRHHDFGNMYIRFNVKFPEKAWTQDPAAFEALRKILPSPSLETMPPPESMSEPADLEDMDTQSQTKVFGGAMGEDEDEEGHPGAERVQCASQ